VAVASRQLTPNPVDLGAEELNEPIADLIAQVSAPASRP
jgi:hypothetical protein